MFLVDTAQKRIIYDNEVKAAVSRRKPYRRWLESNRIELKGLFQVSGPVNTDSATLLEKQWVFGYTVEDIDMVITPMVENSQEPISSMGNDQSLAVLSDRPQLLFNYFKQLFAQVTNPPIDPYRENLVMSLMSYVGREKNLLEETPEHVRQVKLPHPILSNDDVAKLRTLDVGGYRSCVIPMTFAAAEGETGLEKALDALCAEAEARVDAGYTMLILTDRDVNAKRAPIPALLTTSALHHHLTRVKKRHLTALVIETAEAREVMHFATLMGFGASAINPYLALETIADLKARGRLPESLTLETAIEHYITSLKKGLLKVMSKMGVSTIRSYKSAQIFEAVGLAEDFVQKYFRGTPSRIGGVGIEAIAREVLARHSAAYSRTAEQREALDSGGAIHYRSFSEGHRLSPAGNRAPAARRAGERLQPVPAIRPVDQRREQEPLHAPRALRVREAGPRAAGRGGARGVHREAVRHLGHVVRLHQQGSARDPRHRHEPPRRGEQLRGRRGGRGAVRAASQR